MMQMMVQKLLVPVAMIDDGPMRPKDDAEDKKSADRRQRILRQQLPFLPLPRTGLRRMLSL
jgi:hypothetical protein